LVFARATPFRGNSVPSPKKNPATPEIVDHPPWTEPDFSSLPRLKNDEVIGVVDEDAPEERSGQDTVEPPYAGILLDASEAEEWHARQFE
jgi:hypothetical protein